MAFEGELHAVFDSLAFCVEVEDGFETVEGIERAAVAILLVVIVSDHAAPLFKRFWGEDAVGPASLIYFSTHILRTYFLGFSRQ